MAIMRARESFTYWDDRGVPHDVPAGQLVDFEKAGSELSKRKSLFDEVDVYMDRQEEKSSGYKAEPKPKTSVETATAVPGEKRSVSSPTVTNATTKTASRPATPTTKEGGK